MRKLIFALAILTLATVACNKTGKDDPVVEQHDIIIELNGGNATELDRTFEKYNIDEIKKLDKDKTVRYIYLTPINNTPVMAFVPPGPLVTQTAASSPDIRVYPSAAIAEACS